MGAGQREWVVYLIGEKRLPAELQRGGSSHEQACLLAHQEATIRRAQLGQLPFVHICDKEGIKTDPVTEPYHIVSQTQGTIHPSLSPRLPGKTAQRNLSFCRDPSHSTEPGSRLEHKKSSHHNATRCF